MSKPEKITLVLEADARQAVARWADEEGRPVSNLLRRIVVIAIEQRRRDQQVAA